MNKRFVLSAAGVSAAALGATAAADVIEITMNWDYFASTGGEGAFSITNSDGELICSEAAWGGVSAGSASGYLSSTYGAPGSSRAFRSTTVFISGNAGDEITVTLTDTWGDGWNDTNYGGIVNGDWAIEWEGNNYAFNDGASVAYTFTIPTPGALALLGLAGVAGVQRRRK